MFNMRSIPLESREIATMLRAEPKDLAKQAAKEKSPSPTSNIFVRATYDNVLYFLICLSF